MKLKFLIISIPLFFVLGCYNNTGTSVSDTTNIKNDLQQIANSYVDAYKKSDHFTAMGITAQCNNINPITVFAGTVGEEDSRTPDMNNLWQIGSNTKSFTSIVLLQLEKENPNFSIKDSLVKWFPEYSFWKDSNGNYPTVQQLMNMTSGIPSGDTEDFFKWYFSNQYIYISPENKIAYAPQHLDFTPGSSWYYSNTNYEILGRLIEKLTGKSYAQAVTERIINKLNLKHTYVINSLPTDAVQADTLMHGYYLESQNTRDGSKWNMSWAFASGNIISTTEDINKYYRKLFTSDDLLNKEQLVELSQFVVDSSSKTNVGQPVAGPQYTDGYSAYALGIGAHTLTKDVATNYPNLLRHIGQYQIVYHYLGGMPGFAFYYVYNPINKISMVFSVNADPNNYFNHLESISLKLLDYLDGNCNYEASSTNKL